MKKTVLWLWLMVGLLIFAGCTQPSGSTAPTNPGSASGGDVVVKSSILEDPVTGEIYAVEGFHPKPFVESGVSAQVSPGNLNCVGGTGPYHRLIRTGNLNFQQATVFLPSKANGKIGDMGAENGTPYVYMGGWGSGSNGYALDAGFQYSSRYDTWSPILNIQGASFQIAAGPPAVFSSIKALLVPGGTNAGRPLRLRADQDVKFQFYFVNNVFYLRVFSKNWVYIDANAERQTISLSNATALLQNFGLTLDPNGDPIVVLVGQNTSTDSVPDATTSGWLTSGTDINLKLTTSIAQAPELLSRNSAGFITGVRWNPASYGTATVDASRLATPTSTTGWIVNSPDSTALTGQRNCNYEDSLNDNVQLTSVSSTAETVNIYLRRACPAAAIYLSVVHLPNTTTGDFCFNNTLQSTTDILRYSNASASGNMFTSTFSGGSPYPPTSGSTLLNQLGTAPVQIGTTAQMVPGDLNSDRYTDILVYDSTTGIPRVFSSNGTGSLTQISNPLQPSIGQWDLIVPIRLRQNLETWFLAYRKSTGVAAAYQFLSGTGLLQQFGPSTITLEPNQDTIVAINSRNKLSSGQELLSYQRSSGIARFFDLDVVSPGVLTGGPMLCSFLPCTANIGTWDIVVPGNFDGDFFTDIYLYNGTTAQIRTYRTEGVNSPTLVRLKNIGSNAGWTRIIPGNFNTDHFTDLLFYNGSSGQARFFYVDWNSDFSPRNTVTLPSNLSFIVPGNFN